MMTPAVARPPDRAGAASSYQIARFFKRAKAWVDDRLESWQLAFRSIAGRDGMQNEMNGWHAQEQRGWAWRVGRASS
jgi:hypothetical protein